VQRLFQQPANPWERCALSKSISRKGPRNCRSLHGKPGQVGFARDDKKGRVVERVRTVVKGQGGCWGGGDTLPLTTALSIDSNRFCAKSKKSQPLGMTKGRETFHGKRLLEGVFHHTFSVESHLEDS
jgi:hypothetical protein